MVPSSPEWGKRFDWFGGVVYIQRQGKQLMMLTTIIWGIKIYILKTALDNKV